MNQLIIGVLAIAIALTWVWVQPESAGPACEVASHASR
jgi:hypothetical protein